MQVVQLSVLACNDRVVHQIPARRVTQHELTRLPGFSFFNYSPVMKIKILATKSSKGL